MPSPVMVEGGPLGGDPNVTVERSGDDWPAEAIFKSGPGSDERHLYRFKLVAVGAEGGLPVYEYVRTLEADEPGP